MCMDRIHMSRVHWGSATRVATATATFFLDDGCNSIPRRLPQRLPPTFYERSTTSPLNEMIERLAASRV